jgi:preprotein translocase SecE subunit
LSAVKKQSETKVTRIKATDAPKASKKAVAEDKTQRKSPLTVIKSIGGYFKGAWYELRQVRWPDRKATWGLTLAVLLFTAFFVVLIVILDALFKYLSGFILG